VASAIANAVEDAIGIRITSLPLTFDKVLNALAQATTNRVCIGLLTKLRVIGRPRRNFPSEPGLSRWAKGVDNREKAKMAGGIEFDESRERQKGA
jgi:hypothetical protein